MTIGGTVAGARNVISANGDDGIDTFANGAGLIIEGNLIGTDITGTQPLGNGGDGIHAAYAGITIGGPAPGRGISSLTTAPSIPFDKSGVVIPANKSLPVLSNSIYNNEKLGIELDGGNNSLAAPMLTSAVSMYTSSTVDGHLTDPPAPIPCNSSPPRP